MTDSHGISQPVRRREDVRFLTGRGTYADDVTRVGQVHASFVRSNVAHGNILGIETSEAVQSPGVLAVYTGDDLFEAGLGGIVARWPKYASSQIKSDPPLNTPRYGLAHKRVRHVGEPVAMVVAQTKAQADDAAELIHIDLEELPGATSISQATDANAMAIWDDAPGNLGYVWHKGDRTGADQAFETAAHVVRLSLVNNRVAASPLEVRASLAEWDGGTERFTLTASSQGVQYFMEILCEQIFDMPRQNMRVLTPDVGGGFGVKEQPFPEDVAILFAARELNRPVKWSGTRQEHFLADAHARDASIDAALAVDKDGKFLALRVAVDDAMGAYYACNGTGMPLRNMPNGLALVYGTPIIDIDVRLILTNSLSVGPYRGAGREQASYIVERLVDEAARKMGLDPIALRRRNMIPMSAMPYETPVGRTYDSGDFEGVLDKAIELSDWQGFEARRASSEESGKLRGRGVASYLEAIGGFPQEGARIEFTEDGHIDLFVATQSQGQGHETSFLQVVGERLGVPLDRIRLRQGDSDHAPLGIATIASRSMTMAGSAIALTCDTVIEKGVKLAAHELEVNEVDVEFHDGSFRVAGTDRAIGILDLARRLRAGMINMGAEDDHSLNSIEEFHAPEQYFPNGCHICELEIDLETGQVTVDRYTAVDDVGTVVNPMIVHGQIQGGVAQGIGQALMEGIQYDEQGQLLTGTFMDYAMPRADHQPVMVVDFHPVPSPGNPLGVKGAGEAGVVGALPAVMNAIADVLAQRNMTLDFDMPATPEKVWRALSGSSL